MRPLEESEIQQVFEKLFKFVGKNLKNIVDRGDQPHCFRLHKKVRRDSRSAPRSRPASLFPRWGKSTLMLWAPWSQSVSAMMKEISALLIPHEVHQILMVEFLRLSRTAQPRSTTFSLASLAPGPKLCSRANPPPPDGSLPNSECTM